MDLRLIFLFVVLGHHLQNGAFSEEGYFKGTFKCRTGPTLQGTSHNKNSKEVITEEFIATRTSTKATSQVITDEITSTGKNEKGDSSAPDNLHITETTNQVFHTVPTGKTPVWPSCHFHFNNSCYEISTTFVAHGLARVACENQQSHLAIIESEEEQQYILEIIALKRTYWIGAQGCSATKGSFWDDGRPWRHSDSLPDSIKCDGHDIGCFAIQKTNTARLLWKHSDCLRHRRYVCEYEAEKKTKACPSDVHLMVNSENKSSPAMWSWEKQTNISFFNGTLSLINGTVVTKDSKPDYFPFGIHHLLYRFPEGGWCSLHIWRVCWSAVNNDFRYLYRQLAVLLNTAKASCHFFGGHIIQNLSADTCCSIGSPSKTVWRRDALTVSGEKGNERYPVYSCTDASITTANAIKKHHYVCEANNLNSNYDSSMPEAYICT